MFKRFMLISLFGFSILSLTANTPLRQLTLKDTIKDASIQVPLELERNLDQMLVDWQNSYRKSADCGQYGFTERIYPDSVYINRLYNYPSEMELAYNQIVRSYIDMYASRRSTSVQYMLAKGKYYFPFIEETLDRYGLPLELKFLPVIESALNPVAVSRAGATGLWQFMLRTGKMYDLEVNSLVDERRDPVKATEAAARYLKDLYDIYGDWNLVIAAYNCGPGNVNKAIRRSGGQTDYWAIYNNLPRETRGYVPAFIAATYIMIFYPEHNICPMEYIYPVSVDTVHIDRNLHFRQISEVLNIPMEEIRELNPQYKKDIIPGGDKKYSLCLPSQVIAEFVTHQDKVFEHNAQTLLAHRKVVEVEGGSFATGKATKTHKIKSGESLGVIAKKYGVTVAHLKRMNNLTSNNIRAGKTLVINRANPVPVKQPEQTQASTPTKQEVETTSPVLATTDQIEDNNTIIEQPQIVDLEENNLPSINSVEAVAVNTDSDGFFARYYKSKNSQIQAAETATTQPAATEDTIQPKQEPVKEAELLASTSSPQTTDSERTIYHKVKIGETLSVIAKKYNVAALEIIEWNKLAKKKIKIGQELMIKLPEETEVIEELSLDADFNDKENSGLASQASSDKPQQDKITYRVIKGDSLYIIAKKFGKITPQDIKLANNLKNDKLSVGQVLKIPVN